jgi:2-keto-4-pentenoate hydratase/2-oxohepta-3-ene-1,7-dioic acid hydratase in catechol pathway
VIVWTCSKAKKVQEMRLARYLAEERENYGVLTSDKIACLPRLAKRLGMQLPDLIRDFIASGMAGEDAERQLSEATKEDIESVSRPINEVTLLSPIDFPPKIICLGLNYRDHAAEQNAAIPDEPIIFIKPHTTIIGPDENIIKPSFVKKLDYEAELAIIIERKAKNVPVSEAKSHIFGYTILNDVSARDLQFKDKQWTRGKSIDTFAPIGPSITTENQLQDTSDLFIRTWVNNELRQNSTTKNMVFDVYEIVHHLSRIMTLEPCDIIATGTPAGVGFALKPQPKFLQPGDIVTIEIEKIGILENIVTEET